MKGSYVRSTLIKGVSTLIIFALVALMLGVYFEDDLLQLSEAVISRLGIPGTFALFYFNDVFISPLPPDLFLFLITKSGTPLYQFLFVFLLGVASVLGGNTAWFLGKKYIKLRWFGDRAQAFFIRKNDLVDRYGRWAVALAAMTPIPFSIVSWAAGFLKMDFRDYFLMSLLRIPRFFLYFYILFFSSELSQWIREVIHI